MRSSHQMVFGEMPSFITSPVPSYSHSARARSLPMSGTGTGTGTANGRRGSALANAIGLRKKSEIEIVLDGEAALVHSYSTHDEIKGRVEVKFERDTPFDNVVITFEGQSSTFIERIATAAPTTGRTTGKHTFLKVPQPIDDGHLPPDGIFRANVTYTVPFTFVVPDRLLPLICTHSVNDETVRKEHLQLPPSLGDPMVSGDGRTLMDDMAPDMARIVYRVRARITAWSAGGRFLEVADKSERLRIVPARDEAPPLSVGDSCLSEYALRKEKNVKKGFLKIGTIGRLTAETSQPRSLRLPHPQKRPTEAISTVTTLNLRFDPQTPGSEPPQLDSVVTRLKVYTYYGASAYTQLAERKRLDSWSTLHGVYGESVPLASRRVSTVLWQRHDPMDRETPSGTSDLSRRPSSQSTSSTFSIPEPSCAYQADSPFYSASVLVPIALPTPSSTNRSKVFLPTFHSCIVARTYSLDLDISFRSPGANVTSSHVSLKTPIQISAEGGTPPAHIHSDAAIVAEIEQQFRLYEAGQLEHHHFGVESPVYEETSSTPALPGSSPMSRVAEHTDTAAPSASAPVLYSGLDSGAPPEYHVSSGFDTHNAMDRPGGPRTQNVSYRLFT